jgi:hypothetical protein
MASEHTNPPAPCQTSRVLVSPPRPRFPSVLVSPPRPRFPSVPWTGESEDVLSRVPEDWIEVHRERPRIKRHLQQYVPEVMRIRPDGIQDAEGLALAFVPAPFRFCLNPACRVGYSARHRSGSGATQLRRHQSTTSSPASFSHRLPVSTPNAVPHGMMTRWGQREHSHR